LRDDDAVSAAELDTAVDVACAAGALGARMTGAGFGGCALALAPRGFQPPELFATSPSDGARRLA
jgi:galactokinase